MAEGRRCAEFVMLLEIFVTIPSLVMAEIAQCVRFAVVLTCLLLLFAVAIGAVRFRCRRAERNTLCLPPNQATPGLRRRLGGQCTV